METIGSSEILSILPAILERVARGEEFMITEGGKAVARLIPAPSGRSEPAVRAAVEEMKRFREGHTLEGMSIREIIEEGRRL